MLEDRVEAAQEQGKIVNVHTKGAEGETLDLLEKFALNRVIIHWYSGPLDVFRDMVVQGFYFTVGPEILRSKHIRAIAAEIPPVICRDGRQYPFVGEKGVRRALDDRPELKMVNAILMYWLQTEN